MSREDVSELIRRRLENLPPQLSPLAPPWMNEVLPLLISLGKRLDEVANRLEKLERMLEELKALVLSKT